MYRCRPHIGARNRADGVPSEKMAVAVVPKTPPKPEWRSNTCTVAAAGEPTRAMPCVDTLQFMYICRYEDICSYLPTHTYIHTYIQVVPTN